LFAAIADKGCLLQERAMLLLKVRTKTGAAFLAGCTGFLLAVEPAAQEFGGAMVAMLAGIVKGVEGILLNPPPMLSYLLGDGGR
jgi:hypothetical protein